MTMNLLNRILLAGGLLAAGLTAQAAPLQRADLPANLTWVIHVDVDALRPTSIGKFLLAELDKPENQARLAILQSVSSLDPRTQLHGASLYGLSPNPQDAVLIVYADFDPAKLTNLAKAAKDPEHTSYKSHTIYSWVDERRAKHGESPRVYAAIQGSRVIFGQRDASVEQALDVLDGTAPKLSSTSLFSQFGASGDKNFVEAGGVRMDFGSAAPNAALLRLAKQARLQLNEAQDHLNATLTLEANDQAVAQQMLAVGQGLVSLVKLQQKRPEAVKLANALSLKQDGAQVVATVSLPSEDVEVQLKHGAARAAAKKARQEAAEAEAKASAAREAAKQAEKKAAESEAK